MLQAELLQDPYTYGELKLEGAGAVNLDNGQEYPWKHGYLAFLAEKDAEGSNKKYLELYNRIARFYRLSNKAYFALKFGGDAATEGSFCLRLNCGKVTVCWRLQWGAVIISLIWV